jgi:hypothetical protein
MTASVARGARAWLARRVALLLFLVTAAGLAAGGAAKLVGADQAADLHRLLGGADPTATMSRAHAEIAYQIARLGRLIADIGDRAPDETDVADLRGTLYGLHAILRLHTVQEDEAYLSLGDDAETVGGRS